MVAVFVPIGCVAGGPGKLDERLGGVEPIVAIAIADPQEDVGAEALGVVVAVLNGIEGSMDEGHPLGMPPHLGDDLHDRLGRRADRRRRDPEQPRPLIGSVDPATIIETKRHPRSELPWHR